MKNLIITFISLLMLSSCNAQTDKKTNKEIETKQDTIKPKVDYKVDKEYDEDGNLIKYDSTYTYYYSNIDKNMMRNDSVFKRLNEHLHMKSLLGNDIFFDDFFTKESFSEDHFFSEDFFRSHLERNQDIMNKMFSRMDSIKNEFFLKEYPIKESEKEKTD
ncbi:hypothetical protein [Flavivirga sp. 57AJ16]|uniref:hypothetical protein n=1 Tax=Flavivirga sp. 57AJ16 TaxID=3025307 RepID=UPI00236720C7|nr:hypothetical protein [Flavivirga sp. 57AJ16]MDD7884912.1 hypothetical protein [Flavivirga sp. 57AJ16]